MSWGHSYIHIKLVTKLINIFFLCLFLKNNSNPSIRYTFLNTILFQIFLSTTDSFFFERRKISKTNFKFKRMNGAKNLQNHDFYVILRCTKSIEILIVISEKFPKNWFFSIKIKHITFHVSTITREKPRSLLLSNNVLR